MSQGLTYRRLALDVFLHCTLGGFATPGLSRVEQEEAAIARLYSGGVAPASIAERLGKERGLINVRIYLLRNRGIITNSYRNQSRRLSDDKIATIISKYNAGAKIDDIADAVGCHTMTVVRKLAELRTGGLVGRRTPVHWYEQRRKPVLEMLSCAA